MKNIYNKKIINIFGSLFLLVFLLAPMIVLAQGSTQPPPPPPPTSNTGIVYNCTSSTPGDCTWDDLINAVRFLINWATIFAIQFSVVVIAYAGFKYMLSGDNQGERTKANGMLFSVLKGMIFILLAWVIVRLILSGLGASWINFG